MREHWEHFSHAPAINHSYVKHLRMIRKKKNSILSQMWWYSTWKAKAKGS
jgi:hypothetical protein